MRRVLLAVAATVLAVSATPAAAALRVGRATVTFSPPPFTTGCVFTSHFVSASTRAFPFGPRATITMNASSTICESIQLGEGAGSFGGYYDGTFTYTRNGTVIRYTGSARVGGSATPRSVSATCHLAALAASTTATCVFVD
jgi:hypothetical protein